MGRKSRIKRLMRKRKDSLLSNKRVSGVDRYVLPYDLQWLREVIRSQATMSMGASVSVSGPFAGSNTKIRFLGGTRSAKIRRAIALDLPGYAPVCATCRYHVRCVTGRVVVCCSRCRIVNPTGTSQGVRKIPSGFPEKFLVPVSCPVFLAQDSPLCALCVKANYTKQISYYSASGRQVYVWSIMDVPRSLYKIFIARKQKTPRGLHQRQQLRYARR